MKRIFSFLIVGLVVSVTLAACGDSTSTSAPAGNGAAAGATPAATANMPGMTMAPSSAAATTSAASATTAMATTAAAAAASTTSAPTTAAAPGTTAAMATTMAGTTMAPNTTMAGTTMASGTTMPGMSMAPGTTAASGAQPTAGNDAMTVSLKGLSGAEFETKFMQEMIAHHMSAIDMAKLVPTNTKRPELLKLSQDIISAQNKEISDMTGWLASWYSAKPLADMTSAPGMMDMMGQMDKLKAARDAEFDKMFLSMMIEHHSNAVSMASLVPQKTQRPELLKLSQDIISAQNKEISDMTGWLASWYSAKPLADMTSAPGMMDMMGQMDKLKAARDAEFDKMFLSMMIEHHSNAVSMASLVPQKTQRPELLKLSQDIIKSQSAEIEQMKAWQKAWFPA